MLQGMNLKDNKNSIINLYNTSINAAKMDSPIIKDNKKIQNMGWT